MSSSAPNVLLIIADDFGMFQLGCSFASGPRFFSTPNLDRLAGEGARFVQAYASAPVCSPARASLYTGMHPARLHLTDFIPGSDVSNTPMLVPAWQRELPVAVVTLGDALKGRGYATAHFGKWHLAPDYNYAPGRPMDPESQGFDEVHVTRKPPPEADPEADPHHVDALTSRAIEFCTRRRQEPFFCVLAHNSLHRPELAPAAVVAKYAAHPAADPEVNRPILGAMVEQMDAAVGRLLDDLRRAGRERDTLVVFTADHGPMHLRERRKPLRGAKADLYEGGLRVPLLLRWPDKIPQANVHAQPVWGADLFPTILAACSAEVPRAVDGLDLWPAINDRNYRLPRRALYWHYPHYHHLGLGPCGAIRAGDYKLIEWFSPRPTFELFNLASDPGEEHNLADTESGRRDELLRDLREWRRVVGAQEMQVNPAYDPARLIRIAPPVSDVATF